MLRYAADRGLVQGLARRPVRRLARRARRVMWCASRAGLQPLPFGLPPPLPALAPFVPDCIFFSPRFELHLFSPSRTASSFSISSHTFFLPPRRGRARIVSCPSLCRPREGWAERREAHFQSGRACEARQPRLRDAGRPVRPGRRLAALRPWRFSAPDPRRAISDSARRMRAAPCPLPRRKARRAGSRTSRGLRFAPQRGDATPRSACKTSPETPLMSEDMQYLALARYVVNIVAGCSNVVVM